MGIAGIGRALPVEVPPSEVTPLLQAWNGKAFVFHQSTTRENSETFFRALVSSLGNIMLSQPSQVHVPRMNSFPKNLRPAAETKGSL